MSAVWRDPVSAGVAVLFLALLLGGAALHKLRAFAAFRRTLLDYRVLPPVLVTPAGALVVCAEALSAVLLLLPSTRALGAASCALLLCAYSAAIAVNLARGRTHIDCGCSWSGDGQPLSAWLLLRNGALLPFAAVAAFAGAEGARALHVGDGFVMLAGGSFLLLCYHAADRLVANHSALFALARHD